MEGEALKGDGMFGKKSAGEAKPRLAREKGGG